MGIPPFDTLPALPGLCKLPSVGEMLEDIEEMKRNKIKWYAYS